MKVLLLLSALVLSGCGTFVTMDELEHQATLTGDWSAVERRERFIARHRVNQGPQCGSGQTNYCESYVGSMKCRCVGSSALRDMLTRGY